MSILSQLLQYKIVSIIRGPQPDEVLKIAQALYAGGVRVIEVTLNSPNALTAIEALSNQMKDKMLVGAGTVLDAAAAKEAIHAGARFIIAPCVDEETIRFTKDKGVVSIPGAYTPTEIVSAYKAGADLIKVFPASGPQYIKELHAPLNHIPLMPTGGISLENIRAYQQAGAVAFGIGSSLVDVKQKMEDSYYQRISEKASQLVAAIE